MENQIFQLPGCSISFLRSSQHNSGDLCALVSVQSANDGCVVSVEPRLKRILKSDSFDTFNFVLPSSSSSAIFGKLQELLEAGGCYSEESTDVKVSQIERLDQIVHFLENVDVDKVEYISNDLSELVLCHTDRGKRRHRLRLQLPEQFPKIEPIMVTDLPDTFDYRWLKGSSTLYSLFIAFVVHINSLQAFWDQLAALDRETCVIDPLKPTLTDCHRRIILDHRCSMSVHISPQEPVGLPDIRFFGTEEATTNFREKLNNNIDKWDRKDTLLNNLSVLLEHDLPGPDAKNLVDSTSSTCCICLEYRLQHDGIAEQIPDQSCDKCLQLFHQKCLLDWFMCDDAMQNWDGGVPSGHCPHCRNEFSIQNFALL